MVVDVGGGVGPVTYLLAQKFRHLRFVVQDLEHVITGDARKVSISLRLYKRLSHD